jgi:two-component system sensor histidine kinase DesK
VPTAVGEDDPVRPVDTSAADPREPETDGRFAEIERHNGRRRWMLGALVGQIYLVFVVVDVITAPHPPALRIMGVGLCLAFAVVYIVAVAWVFSAPMAQRVAVLAVLFALSLPLWFVVGPDLCYLWIFIGVAAAALLPARIALPIAGALALAMLGIDALAGQTLQWEVAATLVAVALWMAGFASNIRLNIELRRTRDELARTAVAVERERIGRDLHDILGHSLTAIAVKAGLARRLVDRDTAAATAEITDVERLAREALSDVRATAAGYRDVSLAGELAVARSVLQAAGIRPVLPTAVDDTSPAGRDVFGYVVREAVTNVIRHSGATRCEILLTPNRLEICDDGQGPVSRPLVGTPASGLTGLAQRLKDVGGTLVAGPGPERGFRLVATVGSAATQDGAVAAGPAVGNVTVAGAGPGPGSSPLDASR